jgi:hypothetical protein
VRREFETLVRLLGFRRFVPEGRSLCFETTRSLGRLRRIDLRRTQGHGSETQDSRRCVADNREAFAKIAESSSKELTRHDSDSEHDIPQVDNTLKNLIADLIHYLAFLTSLLGRFVRMALVIR